MLNEINWPVEYLPGTTDNFASNEVIVKDLKAVDVWPYLTHATVWEKYYSNSSDAQYKEEGKDELYPNAPFFFKTFGFPIDAEIVEFEAPKNGIARIAWMVGQREMLTIVWMSSTLGCSRNFLVIAFAFSLRRVRSVSLQQRWLVQTP